MKVELNSTKEVDAIIELKNIEKIKSLEMKIDRLSKVPLICSLIFIGSIGGIKFFTNIELNITYYVILIAILIYSVGDSVNMRSSLIKELIELKFSK